MLADSMMAETLRWWLVIGVAGLLATPVALLTLKSLPGNGYAFARPMGLLIIGYGFWLAVSLGLLPNTPGGITWIAIALGGVDIVLIRRYGRELRAAIEERAGYILAVEIVFLLTLSVAAYLRSFVPEVTSTEKPMDFMLLNAVSRAESFPPPDPWLAGFDVSYYYFGYLIQAMTAKIAAVPTSVAFNLGLAGTAALTATAAFGLGYEVVRLARGVTFQAGLVVGGLALLLVTILGNLEGVVEFGIAGGYEMPDSVLQRIDIDGLETARASDACVIGVGSCLQYPNEQSSFWWWWRATRISPDGNSITEFPFFSFLLGDLHPHVMALPFVLTVVALGLALWRSGEALSLQTWRRRPALLLLAAILLGGLGFLNTWDLPTFGFLVAALVVARNMTGEPRATASKALADAAGFVAPLVLLAVLLYVPFYASFSSQAAGLGAVTGAATKPLHSFLFWGALLAVALPLPVVVAVRHRSEAAARGAMMASIGLVALLLFTWALLILVDGSSLGAALGDRDVNWLTAAFYAAAFVVCATALGGTMGNRAIGQTGEDGDDAGTIVPVLIMTATALLLVLGAELFYIQDLFGARLNTVFKLYYQAWILLGLSGAYGTYWLLSRWRAESQEVQLLRGGWSGIAVLLLIGALLYPLGATLSRTEGLGRPGRTLDALTFSQRASQGEFALATWLRDRAGTDERLVEAAGDQYTDASRVSAWSGVPTVLGWPGHEVQWGRDSAMLALRREDIDKAYTTESLAEALTILRKYGVTYVVVGRLEREKYPAAGLNKFAALPQVLNVGQQAFGQAALYRIPRAADDVGPEVRVDP